MRDILTKSEFYRLYENNIWNRPKNLNYIMWSNNEYSNIPLWTCRDKNIVGVPTLIKTYNSLNNDIFKNYLVGEYLPGETCIVQGNISEYFIEVSFDNQILKYCRLQSISKIVFQAWVGIENYHYLYELLEAYPNHIIEFSLFKKSVGIFNHPLIIWEIRKY